jgi:phosphatidylinositol-3-phosphatase
MFSDTAAPTASSAADRCAECNTRLTHDQRYCVECGARRGPLPAHVAGLIGAYREQGPAATLPPGTLLADSVGDAVGGSSSTRGLQFALPGPRATAAAVIGMLGFGVIVGSLAGGTSVATLASAPLIVVGLSHATPAAVTAQAAGSNASGGGASGGGGGAGGGGASGGGSQDVAPASASPSTSPTSASDTGTDTGTSSATGFNGLPPVKHVFLIVLSDRRITKSFDGGASAGYLGGSLLRQGELVLNYYAVAGAPLANEIAMISGQGPTAQTASDCPVFSRIKPGHKGARSQILGTGCIYPPATKTLAGQLTAAGEDWKAYLQSVSTGSATACKVPKTGSKEPQTARTNSSYLAWRNPFVYFRSLTTGDACHRQDVGLGQLATDLKSEGTTPSLSYIVPSPCDDGSEAPCKPHATPSLAGANRFLKTVVPEIKKSAAYKDDGLIAITFDQAPQTGPDADSTACCGSPSYPNLAKLTTPPAVPPAAMGVGTSSTATSTTDTTATGATTTGATSTTGSTSTTTPTSTTPTGVGGGETAPTGGGGQVGLLLISQYVRPGSIDALDYFNHFSLLASIEKLFGLHTLGYAGAPGLPVFGVGAVSVFNNYDG